MNRHTSQLFHGHLDALFAPEIVGERKVNTAEGTFADVPAHDQLRVRDFQRILFADARLHGNGPCVLLAVIDVIVLECDGWP